MENLKIERIGCISFGIDGADEYLLVTTEDFTDPDDLEAILLPTYFRDCHAPGGYFCHSVEVVAKKFSGNTQFIVSVAHRYDV